MTKIERALSALNCLDPSCERDTWVHIGMAAKGAGLDFDDFHGWSEKGTNYENEKSCKATWSSFKKSGGITAATLFHMAREKGWSDLIKGCTKMTSSNNSNNHRHKEKTSQKRHNEATSAYALDVWERCVPALPSHEYIMQKQGKTDGLKVYPSDAPLLEIFKQNVAGYLVIPCWSDGKLQTLQFIPPNGSNKLNLNCGAKFNDGYFIIGIITDLIYLCEGIGQAWAINQATGAAVVVCFGSGRMPRVSKVLRTKHSSARLVIVPDRGKEADAAKIAADVNGQWVELPHDMEENDDTNDYAIKYGHDKLVHLLAQVKSPEMRYKLLSGADLFNAPPMRWIAQGAIPAEGLAALYGASGSGKSFLTLDMGCAVAAGDGSWFGLRVSQAPVTYVCLEGEAGMGKRVKAWSLAHNTPLPDALRFIKQPFDLLSDDVSELANAVIAGGGAGGLVIIDTLNRAAPGADENSSVDMGKIIMAAKNLQNLIGGVVLLVHHTGKDATKGLRGHSSLYAALDGAIEVVKTANRLEWSVAKSKDDVTGNTNSFKLEIVKLGFDDEGEEITSCVAMPDESTRSSMRRMLSPKSGNQKIIWDALGEMFRISRDYGKAGCPAGRACVRLEEAVEKTRGRLVCEQKRQSERTQAAINRLVSNGLLGHQDGWLWVI
jgi:putative DNA primase/helicase